MEGGRGIHQTDVEPFQGGLHVAVHIAKLGDVIGFRHGEHGKLGRAPPNDDSAT